MVEPILYASFGALIATLIGLMFLPIFWRRAVKLTTRQLVGRLPVSAAEIVAAQDRLRAEHAMTMRQTERKAEQTVGEATRDRIESARARSTELGHLADLADLRTKVAALESEGALIRGELDRSGAEAAAAFEALKEARAAADAAARDLQSARQDASASRAAVERARIEAVARESEIARLNGKIATLEGPAAGPKPEQQTATPAQSAVLHLPKADTPFGALGDEPPAPAIPKPAAAAPAVKAEPDAEALAALRARLDEVADALVKATEKAPAPEKAAAVEKPPPEKPPASEPVRSKLPTAHGLPEPVTAIP